jgi:excisionase family DNA binding protein
MRTLTVSEAAEATGLTQKAIQNRIDRGQLRAVVRDGLRRIPRSELERLGLLAEEAEEALEEAGGDGRGSMGKLPPRGEELLDALVADLHDRLERQAEELGRLRLLSERADSLKQAELAAEQRSRMAIEEALHEARTELTRVTAERDAREKELAELRGTFNALESRTPTQDAATRRRWLPWRRRSEPSPASS